MATRLRDSEPSDLSKRDYVAILKRSAREALDDNITNVAAALAYYAFLAIPSVLLVAVGVFSLVAGPSAVTTIVDKLGTVMPGQATSLIRGSLSNMTKQHATGITIIGIGGLLALWSVGGAMQNLMWALNVAYNRKETRGFVRRRGVAYTMAFFILLAFALVFGLLVLGPKLSGWIASLTGSSVVTWVWWAAQWPLLVCGLLLAFASVLYFGPNVEHRRWRFLTFGSVVAVAIWLVASGVFAFYVSRFGSYNKTWGTLSAVAVLLIWFWLSALALLFGAEVNAETEAARPSRPASSSKGEPGGSPL
jgi:membrane protein